MQEGQVEGRKARRLRSEVAVAESPLPERPLKTIDPPSLAVEQADALFEVACSRKMRVQAFEIADDSGIHRVCAGGRRSGTNRVAGGPAARFGTPKIRCFYTTSRQKMF